MRNRRGQVAAFVIVALVLVVAVVLFLVLRSGRQNVSEVPEDFALPYVAFTGCYEDAVRLGIQLLEGQGGYLELPSFEAGSTYMPFSSQLNFLGSPIPYWYYVSGNNFAREQVPTREIMEEQLARFVSQRVRSCDFSTYEEEGYGVSLGEASAEVSIQDDSVDVSLILPLDFSFGSDTARASLHELRVPSALGALYRDAVEVYSQEQDTLFLESYGLDVLHAYAPVDGVMFSCSPQVWDAEAVFDDVSSALMVNTQALKGTGDGDDYFVVGADVSHKVRFLTSSDWPSAYRVDPSEGQLLVAEPVGNQQGLGALGFCYVAYHYVYDVKYPVLVQVFSDAGDEIFQFPVAVIISGNQPREALVTSTVERQVTDFCEYKNTPMRVRTTDSSGNSVDAQITYTCSGTSCFVGESEDGFLTADFPQCANGRLIARAESYAETSLSNVSTVSSGEIQIVLTKKYPLDVVLRVDGNAYDGEALLSFVSNTTSTSVWYPEQSRVELAPGEYTVEVSAFSDASLSLDAETREQCMQIPRGGLAGILGLTEEKCFTVDVPEQLVTRALSAGGTTILFALDTTLARSSRIIVDASSLPTPDSLEQLQVNYILYSENPVGVDFQ